MQPAGHTRFYTTLTDTTPLSVLGYDIAVAGAREIDGNFGELAAGGALRRAFDFSLPAPDPEAVAWNGFARRPLAAFVPVHRHDPAHDPRYDDMAEDERGTQGAPKTFEHLAKDDRQFDDSEGSLRGIEALGILKGDIDDLGALFEGMLKCRPSFAAWAELSRRINAFFTIWVPARLARDAAFRNIYTVFAGGDDFLFIGPWRTLRKFAVALREDFAAYVAGNALIHFSAGYALAKPGHPIRQLVEAAETALERAKARGASGSGAAVADEDRKNAIGLHGSVIAWQDWPLVDRLAQTVASEVGADDFSNQFTYGLLELARMAADQTRPENARWRARLYYQTRRLVERQGRTNAEPSHQRIARIVELIGEEGIASNPDAFRVALTERIYSLRD